ncbi:rcc01693 family protein [Marivita sp. GX14005]|uniref:rcc01693 family protein n=1 Tax=Marivita sp. GX14005 TaxID=2942276 RepID=UPI00201A06F7|nr:rcc01693 family protein [Marivita sp. GX14005]MCL3883715.1 phage tail assembly chaperone [Marivita sp. GX14005]
MSHFDWPALMRAGMRGLGLRPAEFWALTPAELQLLLGRGAGAAPLRRDGLEALMAAYPDRTEGTGDDRD